MPNWGAALSRKSDTEKSGAISSEDVTALRACLDYVLEDAKAMGAHVTALHIRIAIKELEDFAGTTARRSTRR